MNNERISEERLTEIQASANRAKANFFKPFIVVSCDMYSKDVNDLLSALRAAYKREDELTAQNEGLAHDVYNESANVASYKRILDDATAKNAALTKELSSVKEIWGEELSAVTRERDAAHEIDLRRIRPGYMGVCLTDEEDGIEIREVSHKHSQGRGYLDDDEDVRNIVMMRFAAECQVLAIADRLMILAATMSGKELPCAENTPKAIKAAMDTHRPPNRPLTLEQIEKSGLLDNDAVWIMGMDSKNIALHLISGVELKDLLWECRIEPNVNTWVWLHTKPIPADIKAAKEAMNDHT